MHQDVRDGSWNMLRKRLLKPATIKAWAIIVFDNKFVHDDRHNIQKVCRAVAGSFATSW
jgi:hypothetical protein